MNDFTKLELIEIKRCLQYMIKGGTTPYSLNTLSADKKLKSMIENYCEHKNKEMDCDGGISLICSDCKAIVMDI